MGLHGWDLLGVGPSVGPVAGWDSGRSQPTAILCALQRNRACPSAYSYALDAGPPAWMLRVPVMAQPDTDPPASFITALTEDEFRDPPDPAVPRRLRAGATLMRPGEA